MLPVLAACTPAASCGATEIGPPLWMLTTAMIGIFLLLIGAAVAVGAVYRATTDRSGRAALSHAHHAPWAHAGRRPRGARGPAQAGADLPPRAAGH